MSYNPRSRIPGILAAIDLLVCAYAAVRHPLRYLARRRHIPRHARKVTYVRPIPLTERPYEAPLPVHDEPAPQNWTTDGFPLVPLDSLLSPRRDELHVLGEELLDLCPAEGGYVGVDGEAVAA